MKLSYLACFRTPNWLLTPTSYSSFPVRYYYYANQTFPSEKNRRYICFSVDKGIIHNISCGGYSVSVLSDPAVALAKLSPNWKKDYIPCGTSMGSITYVDATSLSIEEYKPPKYILSAKTFRISTMHDANIEKVRQKACLCRYMYDTQKHRMYVYDPGSGEYFQSRYENDCKHSKKKIDTSIDWTSDWKYIAPNVFYGEGTHFPTIGETIFGLAYKQKFYGNLEESSYLKIFKR